MRQVSVQAANAFQCGNSCGCGNTMVAVLNGVVGMFLHGNKIAEYNKNDFNSLKITTAGWSTNVTKERLNAIPGVNIVQRDWQWYLNGKEWNGEEVSLVDWNKSLVEA